MSLESLPPETWAEIAKYLPPDDIANLRLVYKSAADIKTLDSVWQPYLNRLHAIDPTIKVTPEPGKTIFESFIKGFNKVKERQRKVVEECHDVHFQEYVSHLPSMPAKNTLSTLEEMNKTLADFYAKYIDRRIKTARVRNILELRVTQFPILVLEDDDNKNFFMNLTRLKFTSEVGLRSLPEQLIACCPNLIYIECQGGQLAALPNNMDKLVNLASLILPNNQIESLPDSIGNLSKLKNLNLKGNKLALLPDSIGNLPMLTSLEIDENYLQSLPKSLVARWGQERCEKMLETQKSRPEASALVTTPMGSQPSTTDQLAISETKAKPGGRVKR